MAQMMGFSSFGMQDRPLKRRRHEGGPVASGANAQPVQYQQAASREALDPAPPQGAADGQTAGTDEISLDDDDDDSHGGALLGATGPMAPKSLPSGGMMPSRPAGLPDRPPPGAGFMGSPSTDRPQHRGQRRHGGHADDASRGPWYEGYYDPDSNQNPWARLEKTRGLQPRGSWILRDGRPMAAASDAT